MAQFNNKKINRYLDMAKEVSTQSDFAKHKLGAVAIYRGSLLATGFNSCKTSPVQKRYNKERNYQVDAPFKNSNCTHAEVACLTKLRYLDIDFSKVKLYVYREHKNGVKALARPCPACQKMIKDMGIKEVWFTTENGFGYEWMED